MKLNQSKYLLLLALILGIGFVYSNCGQFDTEGINNELSESENNDAYVWVGDMLIPEEGISEPKFSVSGASGFQIYNSRPWPNGRIPVAFEPSLSQEKRKLFFEACQEWSYVANVSCYDRSIENYPYLSVETKKDGFQPCWSMLGVSKNKNVLNLLDTCWRKDTIIHELGHAFGLMHEHQRPDRDKYITVNFNNIQKEWHYSFKLIGSSRLFADYDFTSAMHYPHLAGAFSPNSGSYTLNAKYKDLIDIESIGTHTEPSVGDGIAMTKIYGPPSADNVELNSLEINVYYGEGYAVKNANIIMVDAEEKAEIAMTDGTGYVNFGMVPTGTYVFKISADGYVSGEFQMLINQDYSFSSGERGLRFELIQSPNTPEPNPSSTPTPTSSAGPGPSPTPNPTPNNGTKYDIYVRCENCATPGIAIASCQMLWREPNFGDVLFNSGTSNGGTHIFKDIPEGTYMLSLRYPGFKNRDQNYNISSASPVTLCMDRN
jgi:hypothetical protein